MPSFISCKGLGLAAVEEILENRPYSQIEDLLWNEDGSWKHSKFNKRALESLIKIRAFSSMDLVGENKQFSSYKHMHSIIIENHDELRHRIKKNPFKGMNTYKELILESPECGEWHRKEIMDYENDLLGSINVETLVPPKIMAKLQDRGVRPLDEHDKLDLYWFMVSSVLPKLTKNKKPYFLISAVSASGKVHKMFCWGVPAGASIEPYTFCVAEIDKNDFGMSTKWHRIKTFDF